MGEFSKQLMGHTIEKSNFEERRNYISMSHAHLGVEEMVRYYREGFSSDDVGKLKCYKGYQMEKDLVRRMSDTFVSEISPGGEITAFDGFVKGHPDFWYSYMVGNCKSVLMDSWIPKGGKVPYKVFMQLQAYMLFGGAEMGIVVYESRESGLIDDFILKPNFKVQDGIYRKYEKAVELITYKL